MMSLPGTRLDPRHVDGALGGLLTLGALLEVWLAATAAAIRSQPR